MSVDEKTIEALRDALDDEYKARATYQSVIDKFGPVRPFVNIIEAEERHASALLRLFERLALNLRTTDGPDRFRRRPVSPRRARQG